LQPNDRRDEVTLREYRREALRRRAIRRMVAGATGIAGAMALAERLRVEATLARK